MRERYNITEYPTLLLFKQGYWYKYNGTFIFENIIEFVNKTNDTTKGNKVREKSIFEKTKDVVVTIFKTYLYLMDEDLGMESIPGWIKLGFLIVFFSGIIIMLIFVLYSLFKEVRKPKVKKD